MNTENRDRALYERIRKQYPNAIITKGYLRQELTLTNGKQSYGFDFESVSNTVATEKRLAQSDRFVANRLGLYILRQETASPGNGVLRTHVAAEFAAVAGFSPAHLEAIWNGNMSAQFGQTVVLESMPTVEFRKDPAQFWPTDGTVELEPNLVFEGTKKSSINIFVPTSASSQIAAVTAGIEHKLVLVPYGFYITGDSK